MAFEAANKTAQLYLKEKGYNFRDKAFGTSAFTKGTDRVVLEHQPYLCMAVTGAPEVTDNGWGQIQGKSNVRRIQPSTDLSDEKRRIDPRQARRHQHPVCTFHLRIPLPAREASGKGLRRVLQEPSLGDHCECP